MATLLEWLERSALHLLRQVNLLKLMQSHFIHSGHELVDNILYLDDSHAVMGVFEDVSEVLDVTATILGHTNYRISQL